MKFNSQLNTSGREPMTCDTPDKTALGSHYLESGPYRSNIRKEMLVLELKVIALRNSDVHPSTKSKQLSYL